MLLRQVVLITGVRLQAVFTGVTAVGVALGIVEIGGCGIAVQGLLVFLFTPGLFHVLEETGDKGKLVGILLLGLLVGSGGFINPILCILVFLLLLQVGFF